MPEGHSLLAGELYMPIGVLYPLDTYLTTVILSLHIDFAHVLTLPPLDQVTGFGLLLRVHSELRAYPTMGKMETGGLPEQECLC